MLQNITCSSDLSVQTIRWMNNGQELMASSQQQLLLPIEGVTVDYTNTVFTCEVEVLMAAEAGTNTVRENFTFQAYGMHVYRQSCQLAHVQSSTTILIRLNWQGCRKLGESRGSKV